MSRWFLVLLALPLGLGAAGILLGEGPFALADGAALLLVPGGTFALLLAIHGPAEILLTLEMGQRIASDSPTDRARAHLCSLRVAQSGQLLSLTLAGIGLLLGAVALMHHHATVPHDIPRIKSIWKLANRSLLAFSYGALSSLCIFTPLVRHHTELLAKRATLPVSKGHAGHSGRTPRRTMLAMPTVVLMIGLCGGLPETHSAAFWLVPGISAAALIGVTGFRRTMSLLGVGLVRFLGRLPPSGGEGKAHKHLGLPPESARRLVGLVTLLGIALGVHAICATFLDPLARNDAVVAMLVSALSGLLLVLVFFEPSLKIHAGKDAETSAERLPGARPAGRSRQLVSRLMLGGLISALVGYRFIVSTIPWYWFFSLWPFILVVCGSILMLPSRHGETAFVRTLLGGLQRMLFPAFGRSWDIGTCRRAVRIANHASLCIATMGGASVLLGCLLSFGDLDPNGVGEQVGEGLSMTIFGGFYAGLLLLFFVPISRHFRERVRELEASTPSSSPEISVSAVPAART